MAKTAPYFPFYPDDWLENDDIFSMTLEEEGAYIRILAAMWKRGGSINDNPRLFCNVLRCKPAKWKKIRAVLVDEIGVIYEENGALFNTRLASEFRKVEEKSKKSAENANKRWSKLKETTTKKPNKNNDKSNAVAMQSQCYTDTDTDTYKNTTFSSIAQSDQDHSEQEGVIIEIPLNDGSMYPVTEKHHRDWVKLYPAVDVMQQLRNYLGWAMSAPQKRKTRRGILKSINYWMADKQDKGGNAGNSHGTNQQASGNLSAVGKTQRAANRKAEERGEPPVFDEHGQFIQYGPKIDGKTPRPALDAIK